MRETLSMLVVAMLSGVAYAADPPGVRLPEVTVVPAPGTPMKLSSDTIYMFDADVDCLVTTSPPGLLTVTKEVGPVRVKGIFADGNGKRETRTYKGKWVWTVDVVATGLAELLVIPLGVTDEAGIHRRMIDANAGPRPPPGKLALTVFPATGDAPLTVSLSAVGLDPAVPFSISCGDSTDLIASLPATHVYKTAGQYTARLIQGNQSVETEVVVGKVPLTAFQVKLQAAYRADGATAESKAKYAAYYRQAAKTAQDATITTAGVLIGDMQTAVKLLDIPPGSLTNTARAIEAEVTPLLPKAASTALDAATRKLYADTFNRVATDLDTIKGN